jgi:GNAT superfamily N-acetyltransferase
MTASDHLNEQQFAVHAGKYAIQYEVGAILPTVSARRLDKEGNPGRAALGYLIHNRSGEISSVKVSGPHQRKGVASAMLDYAREQHPDLNIRHSRALTPDGRAWSEARP